MQNPSALLVSFGSNSQPTPSLSFNSLSVFSPFKPHPNALVPSVFPFVARPEPFFPDAIRREVGSTFLSVLLDKRSELDDEVDERQDLALIGVR